LCGSGLVVGGVVGGGVGGGGGRGGVSNQGNLLPALH